MKKSIIALAVAAGTIAAAQADTTTLYGSVGFSTDIEGKDITKANDTVKENKWDISTSALRIGIKGEENLDNGLQAFYDLRFSGKEMDGLSKTDRAFVGLKGDFGKLTIGKHGTPFDGATSAGVFEQAGLENSQQEKAKDPKFAGTLSKLISYESPEFSGVKVAASAQLAKDVAASKGVDYWDVAATYEQNGITVGAAYAHKTGDDKHYIGAKAGYKTDQYNVVGTVRHVTEDAGFTTATIEGEYFMGKNTFRAGVGLYEPKTEGVAKRKRDFNFALGYQYNFSKRTYAWVEGQYEKESKDYKAMVGIRHNF